MIGRIVGQRIAQRVAIGMAKAVGDLVLLGLDRLEVRETEGVHLLGGGVHRGLHPDREPVGLVAAGRRRDPRLLAGMRLVLV